MYSFNLVHKPWIPCIMSDGSQQDLGLQETLVKAHKIQEVFAESPIVTVSLYRLLLAITQHLFAPTSLSDWEERLWNEKAFSSEVLTSYFSEWQDRFDLFHPEWPFYQQYNASIKNPSSIKRLGWGTTAGNAASWFDHIWEDKEEPVSPKIATHWLLSVQNFAAAAAKSETIYTKDSPWTRGVIVMMQGKNLFETLTLNLLNFYADETLKSTLEDKPIWEDVTKWQPEHNAVPTGILQYLTWPSRCIRLVPNELPKECYFAQGRALIDGWKQEPLYVYSRTEKDGLLVWQLQENKAIWRDSHTLFRLSSKSPHKIPLALKHVATLIEDGVLERKHLYQIQVLGQCLETGRPIMKFWKHERLSVPGEYFNEHNETLLEPLKKAVDLAELVEKKLWFHVNDLAKLLLAPNSDQKGSRNPDPKDIRQLVSHFDAATKYWSQLETPFKGLLINLPNDIETNADQTITYGKNELTKWAVLLRNIAASIFESITKSLDTSSRTLKAVAAVEGKFHAAITASLKDYLPQSKTTTSL
jgi:CRISPR system Cascade subunit CasA